MQQLAGLQLDDFLTNGYLVIENFIEKSTCEKLMQHMDTLIKSHAEEIPTVAFSTASNSHAKHDYFINSADKIHFFLEPDALSGENQLRYPIERCINKVGHGLHEQDEVFRQFSRDPRIHAICQQLGFERVGLLQSMYIFKQPSIGDAVNWHQDSCYLYVEDSDVIGFWFALEDATIENGCLQAIPCPDTTPLKQRMILDEKKQAHFIDRHYSQWPIEKKVSLEVKQGSLVLLHGRLPHASGPNLSSKSRQAYALHVIDSSKHYPADNWLQWPTQIPELEKQV